MHSVLLKISFITIYAYGTMLSLAILVGGYLAYREGQRKGIEGERIVDFILYASIAGIVGSRLVYVLLEWGYYAADPVKILALRDGGLSFHGAVLGGAAVGWWFIRRYRLPFGKLADTFSPSLAIGYAIGRIGCFLNGCCYGIPTTLPWATLTSYAPGLRHPTQLYASLANLVIFGLLWRWRQHRRFDGFLFLVYLILYSVYRFIIEFYRENTGATGGLTSAQVASILIAAISLVLLNILAKKDTRAGINP